MDNVVGSGAKEMVEHGAEPELQPGEPERGRDALQQCVLIQNLIDISLSSLQGLWTKCAASNDLTQQEIRTLEAKLLTYISKQLQCKSKVPLNERPVALNSYPRLSDWLKTVNLRNEVIQAVPAKLSLDALMQMSGPQVTETMREFGLSAEECSRLNSALSCLKRVSESGGDLREETNQLPSLDLKRDNNIITSADQLLWPSAAMHPHSPSPLERKSCSQPRSISVSAITSSDCLAPSNQGPYIYMDNLPDPFPSSPHLSYRVTPHAITITPPATPPLKRKNKLKTPRTPPAPSRKIMHLLPDLSIITRSKSHESQLANRIDEVSANKYDELKVHQGSPQTLRRDIRLEVTHRFSTKSWLSQLCQVCHKNMIFGVKCKHCKFKCHNRCTKDAQSCGISIIPLPKIRRTESVPSDINNAVVRTADPPQFGTLPKALTKKDHQPMVNQLDSSSNPSSTTSSTPSSPAPFQQSNPSSATPPPNPSPKGHRDSRFNFPAACYFQHRQQFIFPDVPSSVPTVILQSETPDVSEEVAAEETGATEENEPEDEVEDEESDELEELPNMNCHPKGPISRKASQTSVYLQEWDIPFEQLELGELIGKGRWGKVHKGRWHGEVAIRLLEIDGNNQDHLKLFKKEVMNYRQTRHENVVLFMGACMHPPHLAIITSFCKGRTLYSIVRDTKNALDINKTRQIAQEIVKGMGYLHAKGIVHKDLKSKNVFYDNNKVVITDFGLFGISGVVQEGRRENQLKLPHGWLCYLAPEIVREMAPGRDEDQLPFSKAADVYAFGTIWYELQARDWPFKNQPAEAIIWQVGSGEGIKNVLAQVSLGKEVTEILSACWSYHPPDRPTFIQLADLLEKLPKLNRRLSHPGHFWKSAEYVS
uniref:non-specific serine/threonine protein kinase n=1 Tax=Erpetoichthys calabaricus TaxID=27687 RepID=A0A8C4S1W9_ERPCA